MSGDADVDRASQLQHALEGMDGDRHAPARHRRCRPRRPRHLQRRRAPAQYPATAQLSNRSLQSSPYSSMCQGPAVLALALIDR
jgi:hypothetical protein